MLYEDLNKNKKAQKTLRQIILKMYREDYMDQKNFPHDDFMLGKSTGIWIVLRHLVDEDNAYEIYKEAVAWCEKEK